MNEWELTDEEIFDAANPYILPHYLRRITAEDRAIANAAVKKLVEWLKDNNQPSVELREEEGFRIEAAVRLDGFLVLPEKEWAELKQEVGL